VKHGVVGRKVERDDDMMYKKWERNKENGGKKTKVMEEIKEWLPPSCMRGHVLAQVCTAHFTKMCSQGILLLIF
jgi:hypothetical protein